MEKITEKDHENKLVELDLTIFLPLEKLLFECFECSNVMIHEVKIKNRDSIRFLFSGTQKDMNLFMELFKMKVDEKSLQISTKVL